MPKTGTSILQRSLALQQDEEPRIVEYPFVGRGERFAHHTLAEALLSEGPDARVVSELTSAVAAAHVPVVISSELLTNVSAEKLLGLTARLRSSGDVMVVQVVRETCSFLESMYLQTSRAKVMEQSFEEYVGIRLRAWLRQHFQKISRMREALGESFCTPLVVPGFDSLAEIRRLVSVESWVRPHHMSLLPRTEKRSLKAQIVLAFQTEVERAIGHPLNRGEFLKALKNGMTFEDDSTQYTIVDPTLRQRIVDEARKWARETMFTEYLEAFPAEIRDPRPLRQLDLSVLTKGDLERVSSIGRQP